MWVPPFVFFTVATHSFSSSLPPPLSPSFSHMFNAADSASALGNRCFCKTLQSLSPCSVVLMSVSGWATLLPCCRCHSLTSNVYVCLSPRCVCMWWSRRSATILGTAHLLTVWKKGMSGHTWRTTAVSSWFRPKTLQKKKCLICSHALDLDVSSYSHLMLLFIAAGWFFIFISIISHLWRCLLSI